MGAPAETEGDDEALNEPCALCAARESVDAAVVRSGVDQITIVCTYTRAPLETAAVESTKALIVRGGLITRGHGGSREDAIVDALQNAGIDL